MHQSIIKLIFDSLGWIGALLFLISYFFLVTKRWASTSVVFHLYNILGGVFLSMSTFYDGSYPAAFINLAWAFIAAYGLYHDWGKKNKLD